MKDAVDGYNDMKKDMTVLRLLLLLVFPKTLMIAVAFVGYLIYAS